MEVFHFFTEGKGKFGFWEAGKEGGKIEKQRKENVSDSYSSAGKRAARRVAQTVDATEEGIYELLSRTTRSTGNCQRMGSRYLSFEEKTVMALRNQCTISQIAHMDTELTWGTFRTVEKNGEDCKSNAICG